MLRIKNSSQPLFKGWLIGLMMGVSAVIAMPEPAQAQTETQAYQTPASTHIPVKQVAQIWSGLDANQRHYVDLVAADFFNRSLSIEDKRQLIKDAHGNPIGVVAAFPMLSDHQKSPFRRYALEQLNLGGAAAMRSRSQHSS